MTLASPRMVVSGLESARSIGRRVPSNKINLLYLLFFLKLLRVIRDSLRSAFAAVDQQAAGAPSGMPRSRFIAAVDGSAESA